VIHRRAEERGAHQVHDGADEQDQADLPDLVAVRLDEHQRAESGQHLLARALGKCQHVEEPVAGLQQHAWLLALGSADGAGQPQDQRAGHKHERPADHIIGTQAEARNIGGDERERAHADDSGQGAHGGEAAQHPAGGLAGGQTHAQRRAERHPDMVPEAGDDRDRQQRGVGLDGRVGHEPEAHEEKGEPSAARQRHLGDECGHQDEDQTGDLADALRPEHLLAGEAQRVDEKVGPRTAREPLSEAQEEHSGGEEHEIARPYYCGLPDVETFHRAPLPVAMWRVYRSRALCATGAVPALYAV